MLRAARALAGDGHEVTIVELAPGPHAPVPQAGGYSLLSALPHPGVKRWVPFKLHRLVSAAAVARAAARLRPDVVHAHDVAMLPSGWLAARRSGARLVYDSHEYAAGVAYRSRPYRALVTLVEGAFVPGADAVVTVSDGIAARIAQRFRLRRPPVVVRNVCDLPPPAAPDGLRAELGLDGLPLVLHQGAPAPHRGCETLVAAAGLLDNAHVVFLGDGEPTYMTSLRAQAARTTASERIHFVPARPPAALLAATAEADLGVTLLEDSCENHRLALPNKVFEYVAAGVPVVASDLPELRALVEQTGIGRLADASDPRAVADSITQVLAARESYRDALAAAADTLSWDRESQALLQLYRELERSPR